MSETSKPAGLSEADAAGRAGAPVRVGMFPPLGLLEQPPETARAYLARVAAAAIDHICCGDHVSFFGGMGFDGLVQAAALAMLHPALPIHTGVYLLPLRHPVLVARQLADIARIAPGRLVFGTGIGGEDRHEVAACGVDPASRGRRMDECLTVVRQLLTGKAVTFHGTFFDLDDVAIAPAPAEPAPVIVGGRSDVAVRRAGRPGPPARHAMQMWCGLADTKEAARAYLAPAMEAFYQLPFERFERYCPYGSPDDIAEFLAPYAAAGCREFNLIPQAPDHDYAIAGTAAVKRALERA